MSLGRRRARRQHCITEFLSNAGGIFYVVKCRRHMAENETENSRYAIGETTELE